MSSTQRARPRPSFMACAAAVLALALPSFAAAQELTLSDTTEPIGPGITLRHFQILDQGGWTDAQVLRVDLTQDDVGGDLLSAEHVADASPLSEQADAVGAVAGVNGDFFDINNSSAALGWEVQGGALRKSSPDRPRVAGVAADGLGHLAELALDATVGFHGAEHPVAGVNVPSGGTGSIVAFNSEWGAHTRSRATIGATQTREVIVRDGVVVSTSTTPGSGTLATNEVALVGREGGATALAPLASGDPVELEYSASSSIGQAFEFAVGGPEFLVRDGVVPPAIPGEDGDHPRTAIGFDDGGETMLLLIADGRQGQTVLGLTRLETAQLMAELGADDAMLLDGGGSTTMVARALGEREVTVRNKPSDGHERHDPNGVGLFVEPGDGVARELVVGPGDDRAEVFPGLHRAVSAKAVDDHRTPVDLGPHEVTWSAAEGTVSGRRYRAPATATGPVRLRASSATASGDTTLTVLGELAELEPSSQRVALAEQTGPAASLIVNGRDAEGFSAQIDPIDIDLEYDEDVIAVSPDNGALRIAPRADGGTVLKLTVGEETALVPVVVGARSEPLSGFDTPGVWSFRHDRAPNGGISIVDAGHTGEGIRVDYDFTGSTATRSAGVAAATPMQLPGQPLRVSVWVNGDGNGQWLRIQAREVATSRVFNLDGPFVTWTGWRKVTIPVPAGTQFPIQLENVRLIETAAARQYAGSFVLDDLEFEVPAETEPAPLPPLDADRLIDADGVLPSTAEGFEFAALSDVQFTAANPELVPVAVQALRRIRTHDPEFVVLNGDIVDTGYAADIELARETLEAGGCDLVPAGEPLPEPTAETVPCLYVPGNHEAYGTGNLDVWEAEFGAPYRTFDHDGTRFVLLNSSLGTLRGSDFGQLPMLDSALAEAEADAAIHGVVVFAHHPTDDPDVADASQLGERKEVALIERMLADFRAASGKGAAMVGSHAQIVNVDRVDGVPYMVMPTSGKAPYGTPDRGGFTGWVRFGVDPASGPDGTWLAADVRGFAHEVTLDAPAAVQVGDSAALGGELVQPTGISPGNRRVPLRYPMSVHWAASEELAVGSGGAAIDAAREAGRLAIVDPASGRITGLRAGEVTVAVEADSMRVGDDLNPIRAETTVAITAPGGPGPRLETTAPSFADQPAGTVGAGEWLTVTNAGDAPLAIESAKIEHDAASAGDFLVATDSCTGASVEPGEGCELLIRFAPARANQTSTAAVKLRANTPERIHTVALSANSTAAPGGGGGGGGTAEPPPGGYPAPEPQAPTASARCGLRGRAPHQRVRCKVSLPERGEVRKRAQAKLVRKGRTYAAGTTSRLEATRRIRPGHYTLRVGRGDAGWRLPVALR